MPTGKEIWRARSVLHQNKPIPRLPRTGPMMFERIEMLEPAPTLSHPPKPQSDIKAGGQAELAAVRKNAGREPETDPTVNLAAPTSARQVRRDAAGDEQAAYRWTSPRSSAALSGNFSYR